MLDILTLFLFNIIVYNIPLLYGTTGEIMIEKSGSLNLGVEGIMYMGGIFGLIAPNLYETAVGEGNASSFLAILLAILAAFAVGAVPSKAAAVATS